MDLELLEKLTMAAKAARATRERYICELVAKTLGAKDRREHRGSYFR